MGAAMVVNFCNGDVDGKMLEPMLVGLVEIRF